MKTKTRQKSRILETVHKTAKDLYASGFIDKRRMLEYDAFCLTPVPRYTRTKIRRCGSGIESAKLSWRVY
jgi:putative transcriptional regulator